MPEPTPEPPVSDAGESDSDAACGDEDALIRLPKIFNVPSLVLLDGDGFVLWLTKQDKLRQVLFEGNSHGEAGGVQELLGQ